MTASDVERMGKLTYPYHIVFSKCGSLTKFVKNVNSWAGTQQCGEHLLMSGALAKHHPFAVFLSTKEVLVGTASRGGFFFFFPGGNGTSFRTGFEF